MTLAVAFRLLLGAAIGAAGGLGLSHLRACASEHCRTKAHTIFTAAAGAVFGAAVAWYLINR